MCAVLRSNRRGLPAKNKSLHGASRGVRWDRRGRKAAEAGYPLTVLGSDRRFEDVQTFDSDSAFISDRINGKHFLQALSQH